MNSAPRVGIVGGYGAVGRSAALRLQASRLRLRIGGRNTIRGQTFVGSLGRDSEWQSLDVDDVRSLASFCAGCAVVVNCAGPASAVAEKIARAAFVERAHYIDSNWYEARVLPCSGRAALLAAGMYPGLSSLLPRYLATQGFDAVTGLTAYIGGCDRLSRTAAIDYIDSLVRGFGRANVAWLGGRRAYHALATGQKVRLPFFPRSVVLQPYLSAEAERLSAALSLSDSRWYTVFDGPHVIAALPLTASRRTADSLVKAAEMDLFGREPYHILLFEMTGTRRNATVWRTLFLKASSGAELTGVAMAAGVIAALKGEIPEGVHFFADRLNPRVVVDYLRRSKAVLALEVFDGCLATAEEGAF